VQIPGHDSKASVSTSASLLRLCSPLPRLWIFSHDSNARCSAGKATGGAAVEPSFLSSRGRIPAPHS